LTGTGTIAKDNPFRFSTKRTDDTTDLVLYEYRAYSPSLGRWISRDPIEEEGGPNLFQISDNNLISEVDPLGLFAISITAKSWISQPIAQGSVPGSGPLGGLRLAVVRHSIEKLTNDNVVDDAIDGRYRLLSQRVISVDCCKDQVMNVNFGPIFTDTGTEGFVIPPDLVVTERGYGSQQGSVRFLWMVKGRPDPKAEILMNNVRLRKAVYIWHRVIGSIRCANNKPIVTLRLENSRFRSADLFYRIDGGTVIRAGAYAQGTLSLLWNSDAGDETLVE
jgi:RHS repeat-associated protein